MQFDLKIPRWLAVPLVTLWAASIAVGTIAAAVSIRANLHYLEGSGSSPPPPYPGQPAAMQGRHDEPAGPKQPEPNDKRRRIRP